VDGEAVAADAVVIAMGPWSAAATQWLPVPPITGQKYHSVVARPQQPVPGDMLFTSFRDAQGELSTALLS
jgi:hypothetical protein